jgi:hypothetical protein
MAIAKVTPEFLRQNPEFVTKLNKSIMLTVADTI